MDKYQVFIESEVLHQLFINPSKDKGMAALLESILNQILQAQATEQLAAEPYERTGERQGYRNGSYPRELTLRTGKLKLRIPRLRDGQFSTDMFARYQRSEQALTLALMEMVVNGVSTRKVTRITEELCGTEFSKSTVSDLCKNLDPIVKEWNERSLKDNHYPFVVVDALILKVRETGQVRNRSMMVAYGINDKGHREILGIKIGNSETKASWSEFFSSLKKRGLHGVDLIVSDNHGGLTQAIRTHFQGVTWQRCQAHFIRNIMDATPKHLQSEIRQRVRAVFDAPDLKTSRMHLNQVLEDFETKSPKTMKILEAGFDDATAVFALPEKYRRRLRTTNVMERLNQEIRRREKVIRIFPNRESAIRLIGAFLMEEDEKWASAGRYFDMTEYHEAKSL